MTLLAGMEVGVEAAAIPLQNDGQDWEAAMLFAAMCLAVGGVSLKLGTDRYRKSRIVKNTATERVRSVAVGRTELTGRARPYDGTYAEPFGEDEGVYVRWEVKEFQEKKPHDDEDDTKTWKTIASGSLGNYVVLEDDTGAITIEPSTGDLTDDLVWQEEVPAGSVPPGKVTEFLDSEGVSTASSNKRRFVQRVIRDDTELYAFGEARRHDDELDPDVVADLHETHDNFVDELLLGPESTTGQYIVSDGDEDDIARGAFLWTVAYLVGGLAFVALGAGLLGYGLELYGLL